MEHAEMMDRMGLINKARLDKDFKLMNALHDKLLGETGMWGYYYGSPAFRRVLEQNEMAETK